MRNWKTGMRAGEEGHGSGGFSIVVHCVHVRLPRPRLRGQAPLQAGTAGTTLAGLYSILAQR